MARRWTRAEVALRDRREDAAVIIDDVVYDVTRFLDEHPGGADVLLDNAGRDASRCFRDVGHSADAVRWRARFAVGELAEAERSAPPAAPEPGPEPEPEPEPALRGLLRAVAPPLLLAAAAVLLYGYLFA